MFKHSVLLMSLFLFILNNSHAQNGVEVEPINHIHVKIFQGSRYVDCIDRYEPFFIHIEDIDTLKINSEDEIELLFIDNNNGYPIFEPFEVPTSDLELLGESIIEVTKPIPDNPLWKYHVEVQIIINGVVHHTFTIYFCNEHFNNSDETLSRERNFNEQNDLNSELEKYYLFDLNGRLLLESTSLRDLNVQYNNLNSGLYIICKSDFNRIRFVKRFFKE